MPVVAGATGSGGITGGGGGTLPDTGIGTTTGALVEITSLAGFFFFFGFMALTGVP